MQNQEFSEIAGKLLDRINSISFLERKQKGIDLKLNNYQQGENKKAINIRNYNYSLASPQTQTVLQLAKIEQNLNQNEQENCRKFKNLNEEENETRLKINENFIHNIDKVQKNMQTALANIRRVYSQRQKKLQMKIDQTLKQQKKQILQQLQHNNSLVQGIQRLKKSVQNLNEQLIQMKKSRIQLQDKITKQFNNQITDLKTIFIAATKQRDQRELKILQMLKNVYRKHMQSLKKQQIQRDANQKMFLTVIQQLIDRITQA